MTDEQIKQNAEAYADVFGRHMVDYYGVKDAYIAGAHSRDEEIESLQKQIVHLSQREQMLFDREVELIAENDQLRNPWISVKDRLPKGEDNPDEYNAPHRARSSSNVIITDGSIINRGYYSYARMRWEWNEGEINVTHWMPIPELRKGELK